jgi:hypothetical protein
MQNLTTSRITVTTSNGTPKELVHKDLIETHIIKANEKKYHQTEGFNPLQHGQLLKDIGTLGTGPQVEKILQGTYTPPPGTNRITRMFLKMMQRPNKSTVIPPVSFQEFCLGWSKAREQTSSNGPHFGHYKAALHHKQISTLLYH